MASPRASGAHDTLERASNGDRLRAPEAIPPPGVPGPYGREVDVPLAWAFLPETPVPTGSAPNVLVAAELPCDYRPLYANVTPPADRLGVRLRARYAGTATPDPSRPCARPNLALHFVSLQRLRLGSFVLSDATPLLPGWGHSMRAISLRVVPDDAALPSAQARQSRRCSPGDDASCTGGGVCAAIPGIAGRGVCVPPLDPYLRLGRPCPDGSSAIDVVHDAPFDVSAAPPPGVIHACLPSCAADRPCGTGTACESVGGTRVCLPP